MAWLLGVRSVLDTVEWAPRSNVSAVGLVMGYLGDSVFDKKHKRVDNLLAGIGSSNVTEFNMLHGLKLATVVLKANAWQENKARDEM